jgi:uncharacterized protein
MKRDAEAQVQGFLADASPTSNVLLVQGARQVGKTFLIRSCLKNRANLLTINFEKEPHIKLMIDATNSFEEFWGLLTRRFDFKINGGHTLFIDEAQESEKIGSYIRFMKEEWTDTKVILTGSSMTRLFRSTTRVPVGRISYLNIQGFNFREYLRLHECESLLDEAMQKQSSMTEDLHQLLLDKYDDYLSVGGLPDAVIARKEGRDWESALNFILASQVEDFLRIENLKSYLFLDGLKGVANHVGGPSMYTHIASNNYDAKKIVQKLLEWSLILEVDQRGAEPTQKFAPKRYVYDIGVLRLVRDTAIPQISVIHTVDERLRTPLGGLIENAVLLQLREGSGGISLLSGWKKNHKEPIEVDFVLKRSGVPTPIEVKATRNATNRHCKNIVNYCNLFGVKRGVLLSLDRFQTFNIGDIVVDAIPVYLAEMLS